MQLGEKESNNQQQNSSNAKMRNGAVRTTDALPEVRHRAEGQHRQPTSPSLG